MPGENSAYQDAVPSEGKYEAFTSDAEGVMNVNIMIESRHVLVSHFKNFIFILTTPGIPYLTMYSLKGYHKKNKKATFYKENHIMQGDKGF